VARAARAHADAVGYDYSAYRKLGAALVVRRHEIDYLHPAQAGDRVVLTTWVESWRTTSQVRRTTIARGEDGVELARALTVWALVDSQSGQPRKVPDELKAAFRKPPP
jgi:acyl-CoA thioester hydrolase